MRTTDPAAAEPTAAYAALRGRQAEVLADLGVLDRPADAELATIVRLAAGLLGAPCATLNLLDADRQCQLSTHGFQGGDSPREASLCEQTRRLTEDVFASADLRADARFAATPWVDGRLGRVRGYASAPLRVEGVVIGTLCVFDEEPHAFSAQDVRNLADLADVVVALLERCRQAARAAQLATEVGRARAFDQALLEALPVGVVAVDEAGRLQKFNQVSRQWHGDVPLGEPVAPGAAEALGLFDGETLCALADDDLPTARVLREGRLRDLELVSAPPSGELRRLSVSGAAISGPGGELLGAVVTLADVTRQRQLEAQLREAALHDALTGLPHRALLVDRVQHELLAARRSGVPVAVLFCDLDGFKAVNDVCGHAAGDEVLRATARRLQDAVRPGDTVARLGGDEFIVVCPDVPDERAAAVVVERVVEAVRAPLLVDGGPAGRVEVRVGASVGTALSRPGDAPEGLLGRADSAMYRVKRAHHAALAADPAERARFDVARRG